MKPSASKGKPRDERAGPGATPVIRPIRAQDNAAVASIIRQVMTEFGAVGCDFSIADAEVDAMCEAYPAPAAAFFVVEKQGRVLGCGGMGPLQGGARDVCELRKMYFLPELRGAGMGAKLLAVILAAAREAGYRRCYLETLGSMQEARRLYLKHGFQPIDAPLGSTGHSGCNSWMIRDL
ncbi:MAG TPA: GNAT family N-acetyltransferase [Xanthomonadales bacterium]|nr:GNAT family N-acetyltransferase [Xanthomonadales bacterium]